MEIEQGFVLAFKVGGGLPGGCVVFPFYQIVEAVFVMAIEQAFEFPFLNWFFCFIFFFEDSASGSF